MNIKLVNEAYTSQTNCLTNERNLSSDLNVRHIEIKTNLIVNRDLNSAINIAKRVKELGFDWLNHIEEQIKFSREMFVDYNNNLQMIKI